MSTARAILVTLRPHQWVKNLFVVAPLVFSKHLFDPGLAWRAAVATAIFCALSGAVYAFNDLRDLAADRAHPTKRHRPLAAGHLSESTAMVIAAILAGGALAAALAVRWELAAAAATYGVINLVYSVALKRVAFVDVLLIASGFLLRVAAGAYAIGVEMSPWLLACTGLLATLLGLGKRAHELLLARREGRDAGETRAALAGYNLTALRWAMGVLAATTCVTYALYTQDARTVDFFGTRHLLWTLPFCVLGIGRFLQLAVWRPRVDSPTEAMLRDAPFLVNIGLWGAAVLFIIYATP